MQFNYYPGCTLSTKAKELDLYARQAAEVLGFPLVELEDWQCCGAVYPMSQDAIGERLTSVRALAQAEQKGGTLVTLCSACYHVIKRVNEDIRTKPELTQKVNTYLQAENIHYTGGTNVVHYLEVLHDTIGFTALAQKVVKPLNRKIGAYYGCLLLRPNSIMQFDDPENPTIMEDFIRALGGEPVVFEERNECCGGYVELTQPALARQRVEQIISDAQREGATELITACPLCRYNLEANATVSTLPVFYFTELLAEALGIKEVQNG